MSKRVRESTIKEKNEEIRESEEMNISARWLCGLCLPLLQKLPIGGSAYLFFLLYSRSRILSGIQYCNQYCTSRCLWKMVGSKQHGRVVALIAARWHDHLDFAYHLFVSAIWTRGWFIEILMQTTLSLSAVELY